MPQYYIFNKPRGCITARRDPRHRTVMDYFPEKLRDVIFPVGRLDKDTEGLLILTDDGKLPPLIMNPESHVKKTYFFYAHGEITEEKIREIEAGVSVFSGSDFVTAPSKIEVICTSKLENIFDLLSEIDKKRLSKRKSEPVFSGLITICEGKKHQVKRMLGYAGSRVVYLKRVSIGNLTLDPSLELGDYREMTDSELALLMSKK